MARWDRSKPLSLGNAVCMNRDEARAHDSLPADVDLRKHYGDGMYHVIVKKPLLIIIMQ